MTIRRSALMGIIICAAAMLSGCGSYVLRGRVVEGPVSMVTIVKQNDPRLAGPAIGSTMVQATLDPQSLGRKLLAVEPTDHAGRFAIVVDEFGAGTLEYEIGVVARKSGYNTAHKFLPLPSSDKRLLIVLAKGIDRYREPDDPLKNARKYLNR